MPHCIHTTKRCDKCGLFDGSKCAVELSKHNDCKARTQNFRGLFLTKPLILDNEAITLIDECSEGIDY